ncbi:MAG: HAD family hydrolase [Desulfovibrionaceae bacterium]
MSAPAPVSGAIRPAVQVNQLMPPAPFAGLRGIIFDCDGVLLDSYGGNVFFYNALRAHFGLGPMNKDQEVWVHTRHVYESIEYVLPPGCFREALELRRNFDYRRVLPHLTVEPGLFELLAWLRSLRLPLGIATSRTDTLDLVLSHLGLAGYFSPQITSFKVRYAKPHPESVHVILRAWGLRPEETAFIGDSAVDQGAARGAGVRFWAYKNPSLEAELYIPDFFTLRSALLRAFRRGCFPG